MTRSAALVPARAGTVVPALGVGVTYQPRMRSFIEDHADSLDFVEIVPDMLWEDRGGNARPRYVDDAIALSWLKTLRKRVPVVAHSIGGSLGSAHMDGGPHIEQLARWHRMIDFAWHSDHLAFNLAQHGNSQVNVGVTLPIPQDEASIDQLAARIWAMRQGVDLPFAVENNVYFFQYLQQQYDDATFLNRLMRETGCYLILDLHNLYTNACNGYVSSEEFLARIDLSRVIEIHVAGGMELDGYYLDAHSGPTPEPVIKMLHDVLPCCPNVGGINFEILGSWFEYYGPATVADELARLRDLWRTRAHSQQVQAK